MTFPKIHSTKDEATIVGHNGESNFMMTEGQAEASKLEFIYVDKDQANTESFKVNGFMSLGPATDNNEYQLNSYFLGSIFKMYPSMPRMYSLFLPNEQEKYPEAPSLVFGTYYDDKYAA